MAISNRDRVGRMFELLAPAMDEFITRSVAPQLPEGAAWTALVAMKDKKKGVDGKEYHRLDPQVQLRMLTENIPHNLSAGWYPFDDAIGRVGQGILEGAARGPQRLGAQQVLQRRRRLSLPGHRGAAARRGRLTVGR